MLRPLLGLSLALATVVSCAAEPAPPVGGVDVGTRISPSPDPPSSRRTTTTSPFLDGKPCDLLTAEEIKAEDLRAPGAPDETSLGLTCFWGGADFSLVVTISQARSLAQIEAGRPGERIIVAGRRAASMARGDGQFAGVCDVALDVNGTGSADIFVSRKDKDSAVACVTAVKLATLVHSRLPAG